MLTNLAHATTHHRAMISSPSVYNPSPGGRVLKEFAVRKLTALLVLSGTLALCGTALARDIHLQKMSADALKQVCDKVGGSFSQDPQRYGCGTDCKGGKGTDCTVSCVAGQRCIAQVIGGRRPHTIEQALVKPVRHRR